MSTRTRRDHIPAWAVLAGLLSLMPAGAGAQEPVAAFDQLNTRLKAGDAVWVTDAKGREIKGKITELGGAALTLNTGTALRLTDADVRVIQEQQPDSLRNGGVIGFAVGGALGAKGGCVDNHGASVGECVGAVLIVGAIGASLGVLVDALVPNGRRVVYRASAPQPSVSLSMAPLVGRTMKGVSLSVSF